MDVDHIIPRHSGGTTTENNLCLSCPNCNKSKGTRQTAVDPLTGEEVPLFNPRQHKWTEHFQWNDTGLIILGLTPMGRATIERLQMNRQNLVEDARPQWIILGIHPPNLEA